MRRNPDKMHPISMPIIFTSFIIATGWVLWSTVIAFFGGKLPLVGWEVNGGILLGLVWVLCLWPIASALFYLIFKFFDSLLWWLDEQLRTLFRSNKKPNIDQLIQQSMPMIQKASNDMMQTIKDGIEKGLPPETAVELLITNLGFPREGAQAVVKDLEKEIQREKKLDTVSKTGAFSHNYDYTDPDVLLMESGLTQAVMADIALGTETNITIAALIEAGMPETKAKKYVAFLLESLMEMPEKEREEIKLGIKQRIEIIDKALSNGVSKERIIQSLMQVEGYTREKSEGIVNYCSSVYSFRR